MKKIVKVHKEPHGSGLVYWEDNIFWVKPDGAFNDEGINLITSKIRHLILTEHPKTWVRFEIFSDENTLGPADCMGLIRESLQLSKRCGCIAVVLVASNILIREMMSKLCSSLDLKLVQVSNTEEALDWFHEKELNMFASHSPARKKT